jgi:hypothetical protein
MKSCKDFILKRKTNSKISEKMKLKNEIVGQK